jgi:hypothetical protein
LKHEGSGVLVSQKVKKGSCGWQEGATVERAKGYRSVILNALKREQADGQELAVALGDARGQNRNAQAGRHELRKGIEALGTHTHAQASAL